MRRDDLNRFINSNPDKWDQRFFGMGKLVSSWSEDASRKVGAVIVGNSKEIRSLGYNGLPRGVLSNIDSRHAKNDNEKYYWYEHAERNAIFNAARVGTPIEDCMMYSTLFPCSECIRAIIQSGIKSLCTFPPPLDDKVYSRSFEVGIEMLQEANVNLKLFNPEDFD